MSLSTQPYKGTRDFYPEQKRLQNYMFDVMRRVAERYGYAEYDAPILESLELYKAKSGQEIVNEQTYAFTDRGGRAVAIRPEMTPSVSRMVAAKRQELVYPVRWYSIPNLWRYERPQRGRLREHWQLNVDVFGIAGIEAEHELIVLAEAMLREFGAKPSMYQIRINSRKLMDTLLSDYLGLDTVQVQTIAKLIDRMHKMPVAEFVADVDAIMTPSQREAGMGEQLIQILKCESVDELPEKLQAHASVQDIRDLLDLLASSGVFNAQFDITIMRGFDYYTDIVFEMFDTDPENNRSMFGGGRYDGLVGLFGVESVPTVGFGLGDVTLANFLESHGLLPAATSSIDLFVGFIGENTYKTKESQKILQELREEGINVYTDISGRKVGALIKNAEKLHVRSVMFVGENELASGQFKLKNIVSGEEKELSIGRIASALLDYRNKK